jgi:hypothetical protein
MTSFRKYQPKSGFLSKIYNSFSLEFWLSVMTVAVAADWIFKFGSNSMLITVIWAIILGSCLVFTNKVAEDLWSTLCRVKSSRKLTFLVSGAVVLTSLFFFTCMTDTAHALILTDSGVSKIKGLMKPSGGGTAAAGLDTFADNVIIIIKLVFALAFIFGLYDSYQKFKERAELQEIVQNPLILTIFVVGIDGLIFMIFGA